jgi:hypothetical protein
VRLDGLGIRRTAVVHVVFVVSREAEHDPKQLDPGIDRKPFRAFSAACCG